MHRPGGGRVQSALGINKSVVQCAEALGDGRRRRGYEVMQRKVRVGRTVELNLGGPPSEQKNLRICGTFQG